MTEIKIAPPGPASAAVRGAATAELALRLMQPLQGLLAPGETAEAEVVGIKEQAQSFQLMLRVTLQDGRQTTLQASTPRAVPLGAAYAVTALSESRLIANLQLPGLQPLESLDLDTLPPGSLIQGRVVATQAAVNEAGTTGYRMLVSLLDTPLSGRKLSVEAPAALPVGSLLTARVLDSQALAVVPLSGRLDRLAAVQHLAGQYARQGSLGELAAALQTASGKLPEGVRAAVDALLGSMPTPGQLADPKALAQAIAKSGLFLENSLAGALPGGTTGDAKAGLLRLIGELLPNLPGSSPLSSAQASGAISQALPAFARSALGALAQVGARQQPLSFPLPSRLLQGLDDEPDLEMLLKLAAAAISRLQTHQLSSLAQTHVTPEGNLLTTWQMEIPVREQHTFIPLQMKFQREDPADQPQRSRGTPVWRIELAFDLEPLGPLQVLAQLQQGALSSEFWAERKETARLIDGEIGNLRERLTRAGLVVGELACNQGMPARGPRTGLHQRFVDETA
ncbi:flagellar hook-length control protein FliK [Stutzerimonas urumqiensis]|uniref:flagellar hook-length control protein FliK n=1 Tax=Stutzerimonas urumqiensis TaxID=638269 RepID=UPI003DA31F31